MADDEVLAKMETRIAVLEAEARAAEAEKRAAVAQQKLLELELEMATAAVPASTPRSIIHDHDIMPPTTHLNEQVSHPADRIDDMTAARTRLRDFLNRILISKKEHYEDWEEHTARTVTIASLFGNERWASLYGTAERDLRDLIEPLRDKDTGQVDPGEMQRYNDLIDRRVAMREKVEKRMQNSSVEDNIGLLGTFTKESKDVATKLRCLDQLINQKVGGGTITCRTDLIEEKRPDLVRWVDVITETWGVEKMRYERNRLAERNTDLIERIGEMERSNSRMYGYFKECTLFLDYIDVKGYLLDDVTSFVLEDAIRDISINKIRNRSGKPYSNSRKNTFIKRNRTFVTTGLSKKEFSGGKLMDYDAVKGTTLYTEEAGTGERPPEAFDLTVVADREEHLSKYRVSSSEISDVYAYLRKTKYPAIRKNAELIEICLRLLRETGLRPKHAMYLAWGDVPKGDQDIAIPATSSRHDAIYHIGYTRIVRGEGKLLAKTHYISYTLAQMLIEYRKSHPQDTLDDYKIFNNATLLGWGSPLLPMIRNNNHLFDSVTDWIRKDTVQKASMWIANQTAEMSTGQKKMWMMNELVSRNVIIKTEDPDVTMLRAALINHTKIDMYAARFRDSFMTLMLSMLVADAPLFKKITGDDYETAGKHYEDLASISAPEKKIQYSDIIRIVFNKE